ncbi:MAG: hypothetical protein ACI9Y1_002402 [Lentisphaeria bacterium]|jgi:hypothetical protein
MKKLNISNMLFVGFLAPILAHATTATQYQKIHSVLYNSSADYLYFTGVSKWNDGSECSNATYVRILPALPGKK